jgi:hypothetical protein
LRDNEPGFWDYVKAAFFARKRVKGLGGIPMNVLYLLGVGLVSLVLPGALLIGLGLEFGYLAWLSHNARFRALVRGERLRERALTFTQRLDDVLARLSPESRARWHRLERQCAYIREINPTLASATLPDIDEMKESGLASLLMIDARLLFSREILFTTLAEGTGRELQKKLVETEARLKAATSDAVKRSLEANLDLLKKRLTHYESARENLQVIDAELERIENQVALIREEASMSRDPAALSARIDAVASSIGEANQFLKVNEALLGALGTEEYAAPPLDTARRRATTEGP